MRVIVIDGYIVERLLGTVDWGGIGNEILIYCGWSVPDGNVGNLEGALVIGKYFECRELISVFEGRV